MVFPFFSLEWHDFMFPRSIQHKWKAQPSAVVVLQRLLSKTCAQASNVTCSRNSRLPWLSHHFTHTRNSVRIFHYSTGNVHLQLSLAKALGSTDCLGKYTTSKSQCLL